MATPRKLRMGLGVAIHRFMEIEFQYRMSGGRLQPDLVQERTLLLETLIRKEEDN